MAFARFVQWRKLRLGDLWLKHKSVCIILCLKTTVMATCEGNALRCGGCGCASATRNWITVPQLATVLVQIPPWQISMEPQAQKEGP